MSEPATLRIYHRTQAYRIPLSIELDGREVTRLRDGENWTGQVAPGRHVLWARQVAFGMLCGKGRTLVLDLAPGDDVPLETKFSNWTAKFSLEPTFAGPATTPPDSVRVLAVRETHRSEEPIGTDLRRIDNRSGGGRVTRTLRIADQWNRMVSLDVHTGNGSSTGIVGGIPSLLALKHNIEKSLERTYAISVERREEFAEEIGVEIEPGAYVTVELTWKRIWQHGVALVVAGGGQENVPYRMAVGLTFDPCIREHTGRIVPGPGVAAGQ